MPRQPMSEEEMREGLECILEEFGYHRTLVVMEEIQTARRIEGHVREGMSREEATEYVEELKLRS